MQKVGLSTLIFFLKSLVDRIPTLVIIASLVFIIMRVVPGGPFDTDKALPQEILDNLNRKFKLDLPAYQQFFGYFHDVVLHGDFGPSYKYVGRNVTTIIAESFPISLQLGLVSMAIAVLIGIPMGILSAYKHNTWIDHAAMFLAVSGQSLPNFCVAALMIYFFAYQWGLLPAALWLGPEYMVLPAITLGIRPSAYIARLTRASMLDSIRADYVRTARAKGLNESTVILKHVLKNSLIPVVTVLGPLTASVVAGSFIIEHIYAIPGMGKHFVTSVQNRDYSLIMGVSIVYAALVVVARLVVDITYALIDPRIRVS